MARRGQSRTFDKASDRAFAYGWTERSEEKPGPSRMDAPWRYRLPDGALARYDGSLERGAVVSSTLSTARVDLPSDGARRSVNSTLLPTPFSFPPRPFHPRL